MLSILLDVVNQSIRRLDSNKLAEGTANYLKLEFSFTQDWFGLTKTAVFEIDGGRKFYMILDEHDSCNVPSELLKLEVRTFTVAVFAGDRVTTNNVEIQLSNSSAFADPPISEDDSLYAQIIKKLENLDERVTTLENEDKTGYKIIPVLLRLEDWNLGSQVIDLPDIAGKEIDFGLPSPTNEANAIEFSNSAIYISRVEGNAVEFTCIQEPEHDINVIVRVWS